MNISLLYAGYEERANIGLQQEAANLFVTSALRHILQHVFAQLSATFVLTIATRNDTIGSWFEVVIQRLVFTWSATAVQLLGVRTQKPKDHVPGRKYCNLLMVDSYEGLLAADIAIDNAPYDDHEYYLIFLQNADALIPEELQQILDYCLRHYWLHCNVMVQTAQVEVLVYTYYPYTAAHCQAAVPLLVNQFDGERMLNEPMFPDKLRNMHGCPLILLSYHFPPFVELSWSASDGRLLARGFEMELMEHLSQQFNFSLQLRRVTDSGLELRELLERRLANISIGYLRKSVLLNQQLSAPLAHHYEPLVAAVERDSYRFGSLALLSSPFQPLVWLVLLLAVALHLFIYIIGWRHSALQVFELLLGSALPRLPRLWLQRGIYAHWLYGSIPLRICYQSLLFHLIRLQLFSALPSSIDQLLAHNFIGISTSNTLQLLSEMPQLAHSFDSFVGSATVSHDLELLQLLEAKRASRRRPIFAITALEVIREHNRLNAYHILPQFINLQQLGVYMPKHSYFYAKFEEAIQRLDCAGFLGSWRQSAFSARPISESRQRHYIGNSQLAGVYKLLAGLYALATLLLCLELLLYRVTRRRLHH